MKSSNDEWWKSFYDDLLADILLENTSENEITETVNFLTKTLNLLPGQSVLDQCCGSGRLTVPMAARGFVMTGIDLAPNYIKRARAKAVSAKLTVDFEVADAFSYIAKPPCTAVFNWWTSFGYAEDDAANLRMLRRAWH